MIKLTIKEEPRGQLGDVAADISLETRRKILHLLEGVRRPSVTKVPVFLGSLPLGSRFSYTPDAGSKVWILLDRGGLFDPGGRVAEADPPNTRLQSVCMAVEPTENIYTHKVFVERAK